MHAETMPVNRNPLVELDGNEIQQVSGGLAFLLAVAGVTAAVLLFNACEAAGEKIGQAAYNATH